MAPGAVPVAATYNTSTSPTKLATRTSLPKHIHVEGPQKFSTLGAAGAGGEAKAWPRVATEAAKTLGQRPESPFLLL